MSKVEEVPKIDKSLLDVDSSSKEEAIRVCTRMRPLFEKELKAGHIKAWKMQETDMLLVVEPPTLTEMLQARDPKKANKKDDKKKIVEKSEGQKAVLQRHYVFDHCFDDHVGNEEVYKILARDIILDTFKGINGCILAYGQTGSGKTHSVMGVPVDPGMLPRSLAEFFDVIENPSVLKENEADETNDNNTREFLMRVSYLEVYMERVNDLLQEGYKGGAVENLDVKEDPKRGFVVIGIHEETVTSIDEVMTLIAKAEQRRHIAQTNFNETSSRSHTIFTVLLESNQIISDGTSINKRGELKIVDLAGNERAGRAAEGVENAKTVLEEGKAINKSLFVLSEVISKLSKRAQALASGDEKKVKKIQEDLVFIPWRDSKLTRILSKSLGGNCRASVIVAVHPSHLYLDTSFSTLRFALKCKTIKKKIEVNFLSPEQSVIMQQKELIAKLQNQLRHLASSKNVNLDALGIGDKPYATKKPEEDEKILELKKELEDKVNKFQHFILKSELNANTNNQFRAIRSIDMNTEKSLKYSGTLTANIQNEMNWLRSFCTQDYDLKYDGVDKFEDQYAKEKINITKAMNYLKNGLPYKAGSECSELISEISEKVDEAINMTYYDELEQLEQLEKDALNKMQQKEKTDKYINKDVNDINNIIPKEYDSSQENYENEIKKKKKIKKKMNKMDPTQLKDGIISKKGDKLKIKGKGNKSLKDKKIKKKDSEKFDEKLQMEDNDLAKQIKKGDSLKSKSQLDKKLLDTKTNEQNELKTDLNEMELKDSTDISEKKAPDPNELQISLIANLKQKIVEDLKKKKKIQDRNVELNKQIKFVMKLMQKVGLSAILTGIVPPGRNVEKVLRLRESLKDKLKLEGDKISSKSIIDKKRSNDSNKKGLLNDNEDMFKSYLDYTHDEMVEDNVQSLSHVFINEMFYSFILRLQQKDDEHILDLNNEKDKENQEDKQDQDISNKSLEDILGSTITKQVLQIEKSNSNISDNTTSFEQITTTKRNKTIIENKNKINEKNKTLDSILNLLTPWEQKILALLYQQQKMRKSVQELKENFSERIKKINIFIKKILIDKIEVEEHFKRVVETIESYKTDLLKTSDVDSNFKFANLMKKLEDISILLADKTRDFNVLAEFHLNLRKSLKEKDLLINKLQEENKLFYLVPKYQELLENIDDETEETTRLTNVKELKKEFLLMYGRLIQTKKKLEESKIIENDMRGLNSKIYTELVESISIIKNLESQYKYLEFKMSNESKKSAEKIKKMTEEKHKLNKVIDEMERMLQEANIDTTGIKESILANNTSPDMNDELKDDNERTGGEDSTSKKNDPNKQELNGIADKKKKKKKKTKKLKTNIVFSDIDIDKKQTLKNQNISSNKKKVKKMKSSKMHLSNLTTNSSIIDGNIKLVKGKMQQSIDDTMFQKK